MSVRVSPSSSLFPCCSELLSNRHFRACMGEVNKCIAAVVAGQGNIDVTAVIITLVACVNGNVMFDQLIRSKAPWNTVWTEAQTKMSRESPSKQFPPCTKPLQRWAFGHQYSMSNHPEPHDYALQLARSLFPCLKHEFDFSSPPHCVHAPTPCRIRMHPARDNAHSWSLLLFLTACLSRTETVTAQVFGTIFFQQVFSTLNIMCCCLSVSAKRIQCTQIVREEIAKTKFSQVGKQLGRIHPLLCPNTVSTYMYINCVLFNQHFLKLPSLSMW